MMITRKLEGHEQLSAATNFMLGYELAHCDFLISMGSPIKGVPIHAENLPQVELCLKAMGRAYKYRFLPDDQSESVVLLYVKGVRRSHPGEQGGGEVG